jgi:hypothetical protein
MVIREGRWDCSACGATGNGGRHTDCTRCGKPRPYNVHFYRSDSAADVVDPEQLRDARAGADWQCKACYTSNRALLAECRVCRTPRGSYTRVVPAEAPQKAWAAPAEGHGLRWAWGAPVRFPSGRTWLRLAMVFGGLLVGLVLLIVGVNASRRYNDRLRPGVIMETRWRHTILVEGLVQADSQGWSLPDSAVILGREERLMRTDSVVERYEEVRSRVPRRVQVVTGWRTVMQEVDYDTESGTETYPCESTDLRNGYFEERECTRPTYTSGRRLESVEVPVHGWRDTIEEVTLRQPVYRVTPVRAPWYRFRTREWHHVRTAEASGVNSPGAWPALTLAPNERDAYRQADYSARVRDQKGRLHDVRIDEEEWPRLRPGDRIAFGRPPTHASPTAFSADSLEPCRRWHRGRARRPPPAELGCSPLPAERLPE